MKNLEERQWFFMERTTKVKGRMRLGTPLLGLFFISALYFSGCSAFHKSMGGLSLEKAGVPQGAVSVNTPNAPLKTAPGQHEAVKGELKKGNDVTQQGPPSPVTAKGEVYAAKGIDTGNASWPASLNKRLAKGEKRDEGPSVHVELAFDNADLYEVLDATLFELFKVNYMVDPSLRAKVTFHISGDYTRSRFINVFNNVLQTNNLAIVQGPGDILKVVRRSLSAGVSNAPLEKGAARSAGDITRMIRLRYLSTASAVKNLRAFLSRGATVLSDTVTNSIIVTDTRDNIAKAASILGALDVAYFRDISWQLFPLKEVEASEVAADLNTMLKAGGLYNRPGINQGSFQILPIKTMNAILVATRWPSILELVEGWVGAMDHADNSGINVFVYFVENGTAAELADILKQVYGKPSGNKTRKVKIVEPKAKAVSQVASGELSGKVEIIPDETNNAIVFKASSRDYNMIKSVLEQLDIVPRQVLIDVMVAEITLSNSVQYGVEWFLQGRSNGNTFQGVLDNEVSRSISTPLGSVTGFTFSVFDSVDFMRALISALGEDSDVNILSSPNILAVDNKEAVIEVGEEVPTVTGQVTDATSGTTVTNTIQYRKTGIILKVTPHINSSGLVKMEISQEVSEKGEFDSALKTFSILNRTATTSLVAEDGQTLIIGGLMKSNSSNSQGGIPFLRKIPILGYLFGGITKETAKTELIILITPHVISNRTQADAITEEFSHKVESLKTLFEKKTHE